LFTLSRLCICLWQFGCSITMLENVSLPPFRDEVTILHPSSRLAGVSSTGPLPEHFPNDVIHLGEGFLRHLVSMVVGPSPDNGIEFLITDSCLSILADLMIPRIFRRNAFTVLCAGLMSNFPSYLRTFHPRKSNPSPGVTGLPIPMTVRRLPIFSPLDSCAL